MLPEEIWDSFQLYLGVLIIRLVVLLRRAQPSNAHCPQEMMSRCPNVAKRFLDKFGSIKFQRTFLNSGKYDDDDEDDEMVRGWNFFVVNCVQRFIASCLPLSHSSIEDHQLAVGL